MISMREAYEKIGANYDDACARLMGEEMLARFALKFLDDESMDKLEAAMAAGDAEGAFMACLLYTSGAGGQVIVIAGGLQLQQLEMLACGKQGRVYVAQDHVGIGDLLVRGGVGARVDKVLARSTRLKTVSYTHLDVYKRQRWPRPQLRSCVPRPRAPAHAFCSSVSDLSGAAWAS